jgi:hypothetical protein
MESAVSLSRSTELVVCGAETCDKLLRNCLLPACRKLYSPGLDKACPQRRVGGAASLDKLTNKVKKPRYNERRRRCRLQRVLGGLLHFNSEMVSGLRECESIPYRFAVRDSCARRL